jgi:hypothetical protein
MNTPDDLRKTFEGEFTWYEMDGRDGPNAGLWMGVSIFMFVCGAFCGYVSRQTVRVRG